MLQIIILILTVIVNTVLGLAVYIKNPNKDVNKLFFYLTIGLSAWLVINYFSIHPVMLSQIVWVRLVLGSAAVLSYFVLMSFAIFPDGSFKQLRFVKPATYYLIFVVLLTQTPLVFKSLNYDAHGKAQPVPAPGIIFFAALAITYLGGAIFMLLKKYRRANSQTKNQLRIVIFGVATSFALIFITNFVLVSIFKNTELVSFAPLFSLILTGSMAYAILKHRLFDIRLAVARAIAYVMTLSLVVVVYAGLAFLSSQFFSSQTISTPLKVFYVSLAVVTALVFQPVKRFFDRNTNKFFFKDAYEPQQLLDSLSNVLVGNIQLEPLLNESAKTITSYMKLNGCGFVVHFSDKTNKFINGTLLSAQLPDALLDQLKEAAGQTIVVDNLPVSHQNLKNLLINLNCAAVIRLTTHNIRVGYMLLGNKKSGDILNALDIRMLNIMADELAISIENALRFEEIKSFNLTLQDKVDHATHQLRHANRRLKDLDQTKDEFISMASHQLRTPLTTIKGYLSMVLEGDEGKVPPKQKVMIQQAFESADHMVYLIADLLNVSRLQSGKFVIESKPTDLAKMVQDEIKQLTETAQKRGLTLVYKKPETFPIMNLDETKIRQVVMNFIDNALYYTPAGGTVTVELNATSSQVEFTVTDTGVGVPEADQHHLFTKFYRADNARKVRPDGTGLGLFMAKKVIVAQGGAIIFKSTVGKGSVFGFSFPRRAMEIKA